MTGGIQGKILRVNLTEKTFEEEEIDEELARKMLGPVGLASKFLLEEVEAGTNPFDSENKIVLASGLMSGTAVPATAESACMFCSPMTEGWGETMAHSNLGLELKRAGYDITIIEGKSEDPVYLWIEDGEVEFRSAGDIWGKNISETVNLVKEDLDKEKAEVAAIGKSGENLVRYACVRDSNDRAYGRVGLGAVMGSKNLKAISSYGSDRVIDVEDMDQVNEVKNRIMDDLIENTSALNEYGTAGSVPSFEEMGNLPVKNWTSAEFDEADEVSGAKMTETMLVGTSACYGCPNPCGREIEISEGPYAPIEGPGPEYETVAGFGPNLMNSNLESIAKANQICNEYGIDTISTGATIAFAVECYEKGILTDEDTNGIELTWGNQEAIVKMTKKIARREGLGDLLAEGSYRAAKEIGDGAEELAMHVKGVELPFHSPYAFKEMGLQYAVSNRGACHLRGYAYFPARGLPQPEIGLGEKVDGRIEEGKGRITSLMQDAMNMIDALGICKFIAGFGKMGLSNVRDFYEAVTGWDDDLDDLMESAERIWMMKRAFNANMGLGRDDDTLPARFLEEPMEDGAVKGETVNLELMLGEYYDFRGLDETGKPTREKLHELELEDVESVLYE